MTTPPPLNQCWFVKKTPPVFIQLGRYGDLILLLPAFKLIHDRVGLKPIVITTEDYASVFDGVSYAVPHVIKGHWFHDMPKARALAERLFGTAVIPQWWQPGADASDVPPGPMVLQCHGHNWDCDWQKYPDFGTSMWVRAGFTREEMIAAPLVFDRRDKAREARLVAQHVHTNKPVVLYNFTGASSPFGFVPEMMRLFAEYRAKAEFVDLGAIRAQRIYDLLGLYDRAAGVITIDTSTLHLCPASKVQSVMLIVDGWGQSVPRGNCAFHCKYSEVPARLPVLRIVLNSWLR